MHFRCVDVMFPCSSWNLHIIMIQGGLTVHMYCRLGNFAASLVHNMMLVPVLHRKHQGATGIERALASQT